MNFHSNPANACVHQEALAHADTFKQPELEDCPRCGGTGDHGLDEDGRVYTCYCCGMSGRVALGTTAAEELETAQAAGFDNVADHQAWEASLRTKPYVSRRPAPAPAFDGDYDDIPF